MAKRKKPSNWGRCRMCGNQYHLLKTGMMPTHLTNTGKCSGSGKKPV